MRQLITPGKKNPELYNKGNVVIVQLGPVIRNTYLVR